MPNIKLTIAKARSRYLIRKFRRAKPEAVALRKAQREKIKTGIIKTAKLVEKEINKKGKGKKGKIIYTNPMETKNKEDPAKGWLY